MATPIVIVASGGLAVTEAPAGYGMPVEVAANGFGLAVTYFASGGLPVGTGGGVVASLKTQPDSGSSNIFYATRNVGGVGYVTRFIRNTGGSGGTDLGNKWPEWRVGGYGTLAAFSNNPETDTSWIANDTGAFDLVANVSVLGDSIWYGSYHGLGSLGSLGSETVKIDGVTVDPTSGPLTGTAFELRNTTTATNGSNVLARDLTTTIGASGEIVYTINSITVTGLLMVYLGMPMASGDDFTELDIKVGTAWNSAPLTSGEARALLFGVNSVRMRNPTTGRFVAVSSDLNSRTGYLRSETLKQITNTRTKTYLGRFTSGFGNIAGAVVTMSWGTGATGAVSPGTNLIADTVFTVPPWVDANTNSSQARAAGNLTQTTTTTAAANARAHAPIPTLAIGDKCLVSMDLLSQAAVNTSAMVIGSNSNGSTGSPAPAVNQNVIVGRNIYVFTATQNAPEQRLMAQHVGGTAGNASVWRNPAAYLLAA